jgi:hypothetical protein
MGISKMFCIVSALGGPRLKEYVSLDGALMEDGKGPLGPNVQLGLTHFVREGLVYEQRTLVAVVDRWMPTPEGQVLWTENEDQARATLDLLKKAYLFEEEKAIATTIFLVETQGDIVRLHECALLMDGRIRVRLRDDVMSTIWMQGVQWDSDVDQICNSWTLNDSQFWSRSREVAEAVYATCLQKK